jgi:hypothetical protein
MPEYLFDGGLETHPSRVIDRKRHSRRRFFEKEVSQRKCHNLGEKDAEPIEEARRTSRRATHRQRQDDKAQRTSSVRPGKGEVNEKRRFSGGDWKRRVT